MKQRATSLKVEFYGIPRLRAGVAETVVIVPGTSATLGQVIDRLSAAFPQLAAECFEGSTLRGGYVASLGGVRFVSAPDTPLTGSEALLILTADAGG